MSTLTKVFTILLVVFSIAFTTMTVSIVAQTTNWRDTAIKYQEHARIADTNLRNFMAASAAEQATARDAIKGHLERIGRLETDLQSKTSELAQLRSQVAKIEAEQGNIEAMNRALLAQLEIARSAEAEYRDQREKLGRENIDLQQRNIDLNGRVNELTAQVTVMAEQRRQFEQQLNILRGEAVKHSQATGQPGAVTTLEAPTGAAMQNIRALSAVRPSAIRGKVLEVSGNLVTISVGTADGVQSEMRFVVHRDGQYVADVTISEVQPELSAGRIVQSTFTPKKGDQVVDALSLAGNSK